MNGSLLALRTAARAGLITLDEVKVDPSSTVPGATHTIVNEHRPGYTSSRDTRLIQRSVQARGRYLSLEGLLDLLTQLPRMQCVLTGIDLTEDRFEMRLLVVGTGS